MCLAPQSLLQEPDPQERCVDGYTRRRNAIYIVYLNVTISSHNYVFSYNARGTDQLLVAENKICST